MDAHGKLHLCKEDAVRQKNHSKGGNMKKKDLFLKRYSVYSLVSTEMFTRPSSPSRPVHTETISIPRGIFQSSWQHIAHKL